MQMRKALASVFASGALLTATTLGVGLPAAVAHDVVMSAVPADGGTVTTAPTVLELEFSGIPKDSFNTIALSSQETGKVLFTASPELENQTIRVAIPEGVELKPGEYKIGFQITSSDGHATRGMTTFTLAGAESTTHASASDEEFVASSSEPPVSNSIYLYGLIGGFAAVVLIAVGVVLALSHRKK